MTITLQNMVVVFCGLENSHGLNNSKSFPSGHL